MSTGPGAERFDERGLLVALFGAGTAAFAQLYAPQAVLPDAARDLATSASATALLVSAAPLGLALGVLPWAWAADRVGRVRAMTVAMLGAAAVGLAVPLAPSFGLIVAGRAVEGLLVAGVGGYVAGTSMGGLLGRLVSGGAAEIFGCTTTWASACRRALRPDVRCGEPRVPRLSGRDVVVLPYGTTGADHASYAT